MTSCASDTYSPREVNSRLQELGFREHLAQTIYGTVAFFVRRQNDDEAGSLLLHGVASDATTWTPMLQCAAELGVDLGNLVLVDLPCFGKSENRLDTMWIPEVGDMLISEMTTLGFLRVRLIGHSMGGFLALDMAARFHEHATSVHVAAGSYFAILNTIKRPIRNIFRNPGTALLWNSYWLLCLMGRTGTMMVRTAAAVLGPRVVIAPFVAKPTKLRRQIAEVMLSQLNPRGVVLTARNGPAYDAVTTWGSIRVPLVAVFGQKDRMVTRWDAEELSQVNPSARIAWVDDAGHMLIVERPAAVLRALGL
ncbi:Pimeloyl-ACP methyl ester carboxylesterase [Micromonospora narathiwatensis]|uniref:Pimeloyl-ACP methyl ester carboxylesterase n=2 Tax=Micromonospora narathiwatensis TaxID=299146 RepID=A0A1A8Z9C6_9ACTN|nr:Pimeloyl-ACP methyl ester carboxylesterase [Micromonospora narathiwatensis]